MKLRITSGGHGFQVENAETGELLEGVTHVHWSCDEGGWPKAVIAMRSPEIDAYIENTP